MSDVVFDGAIRILNQIKDANKGRLPLSIDEALALPKSFGLKIEAWANAARKSAILVQDEHGDRTIIYNDQVNARQQMCHIVHEIAESIAMDRYRDMFESEGAQTRYADGSGGTDDLRHEIAQFAEGVFRLRLDQDN